MTTRVLLIMVFRTDHLLDERRRVKGYYKHYTSQLLGASDLECRLGTEATFPSRYLIGLVYAPENASVLPVLDHVPVDWCLGRSDVV